MKTRRPVSPSFVLATCGLAAVALAFPTILPAADAKAKNPASKVYFSDVNGEAQIDTGETIEDLTKRSVYTAQGTVIETKKADKDTDKSKYYSTMVYSNGTGAFFDEDTRVEVKKFVQEPFTPTRSDADVEPSLSQTQAFVSRGTVGLCNSKMVAGSSMNYNTPLGSVNIRGQKIVIQTNGDATTISMMEGESTVKGGDKDMGGHTLHTGEQAIIRPGAPGQPNLIQISKIPAQEMGQLDEKVTLACNAKKTVYFETRERQVGLDRTGGNGNGNGSGGGNGNGNGGNEGGNGGNNGGVTAFDGNNGGNGNGTGNSGTIREIVPVEVVPSTLPTQFTVSPARIVTPGKTGGG